MKNCIDFFCIFADKFFRCMDNNVIQINGRQFRKYIPYDDLQEKVRAVARVINRDMEGLNPVFVCVLNGAFMFAADLLKEITVDCEITFLRMKSYQGMQSAGMLKAIQPLEVDIKGRTVIVVEDIVDTGFTMDKIKAYLSGYLPAQIKTATMFFKPDAMKIPLVLDYVAQTIENRFIVGYGLDYDEKGRNLKDLYILDE